MAWSCGSRHDHRRDLRGLTRAARRLRATIAPVGQRSPTETLAAIYQAFLARHTWSQSALATEVGVSRDAIRRILTETTFVTAVSWV